MADTLEFLIRLVDTSGPSQGPVAQGASPARPPSSPGPSSSPAGPSSQPEAWTKGIREESFARVQEFRKQLRELDEVEKELFRQQQAALKEGHSPAEIDRLTAELTAARQGRRESTKGLQDALAEAMSEAQEEIERLRRGAAPKRVVKAGAKAAAYGEPNEEREEAVQKQVVANQLKSQSEDRRRGEIEEREGLKEDQALRVGFQAELLVGDRKRAAAVREDFEQERMARLEYEAQVTVEAKKRAALVAEDFEQERQARLEYDAERLVDAKRRADFEKAAIVEESALRLEYDAGRLADARTRADFEKKLLEEEHQLRLEYNAEQMVQRERQAAFDREAAESLAQFVEQQEEAARAARSLDAEKKREAREFLSREAREYEREQRAIPVAKLGGRSLAEEQARREVEGHEEKRLRERVLREQYPDYVAERDAERHKKGPGAVQLTSTFAGPGVGNIVGAAMTGNPLAIGLSVLTTAVGVAEKGVKSFGEAAASIASGDAVGLSRAITGLTTQIPLVGGILGGLGNAVLDVSEGLMANGRRIAQYSAGLSQQFAAYDVRQLLRDIQRANDPEIQRGVQAAMEFRDRMNDLLDKHMPEIVDFMERGLSVLMGVAQLLSSLMPAVERNTRPPTTTDASDQMFVNMFGNDLLTGLRDRGRNPIPTGSGGPALPGLVD